MVAAPHDPEARNSRVAAEAREIASKLATRRPQSRRAARAGVGRTRTVRYRGDSDELDLERTLEVLTQDRRPAATDLYVRERVLDRRTVVLVADVSGSMRGERLLTTAATVGALSQELRRDSFGVVAFWSDAAVVTPLDAPVVLSEMVDDLVSLRGRGLTNAAFPLDVARRMLAERNVPPALARVVLLSDCIHNAGPDPVVAARRLPRLDVVLDVSGEHDAELARRLAHAGRGRVRTVRGYRGVAAALNGLFDT